MKHTTIERITLDKDEVKSLGTTGLMLEIGGVDVIIRSEGNSTKGGSDGQAHLCKECGKSFGTAMGLGGHMNSHTAKRKARAKKSAPASKP